MRQIPLRWNPEEPSVPQGRRARRAQQANSPTTIGVAATRVLQANSATEVHVSSAGVVRNRMQTTVAASPACLRGGTDIAQMGTAAKSVRLGSSRQRISQRAFLVRSSIITRQILALQLIPQKRSLEMERSAKRVLLDPCRTMRAVIVSRARTRT